MEADPAVIKTTLWTPTTKNNTTSYNQNTFFWFKSKILFKPLSLFSFFFLLYSWLFLHYDYRRRPSLLSHYRRTDFSLASLRNIRRHSRWEGMTTGLKIEIRGEFFFTTAQTVPVRPGWRTGPGLKTWIKHSGGGGGNHDFILGLSVTKRLISKYGMREYTEYKTVILEMHRQMSRLTDELCRDGWL